MTFLADFQCLSHTAETHIRPNEHANVQLTSKRSLKVIFPAARLEAFLVVGCPLVAFRRTVVASSGIQANDGALKLVNTH